MNRKQARLAAIERDGGCVLARQLIALGHEPRCTDRGFGLEVNEIVRRGQGGSTVELSNLVTLCGSAHQWVTEHPIASQRLGLYLPSWVDATGKAWAANVRRYPTDELPIPPWWSGAYLEDPTELTDAHFAKLLEMHT